MRLKLNILKMIKWLINRNHQIFIAIGILTCTMQCNPKNDTRQGESVKAKPNIIMLLTDDMGYGDLTCYGGQAVHTPNIDALAQQGMRYTRFYSASAVCSPSRAAILTGRYPLRFNITKHFSKSHEFLPAVSHTLPRLLRNAGYTTSHIGKWHLGGLRKVHINARLKGQKSNPGPMQHGFDHSLTGIEEADPRGDLIAKRRLYRDGGKYLIRNDQYAPEDTTHLTAIKINEALTLLDLYEKGDKPFFMNLWFDVPHTPYEPAPEPHLGRHKYTGATGDQLYFRSMVSFLDEGIGRLIAGLKERGMYENTIIIFTSDNGAAWEGEVGPFKGGKTDLHEGGIRVPFFTVWDDKIPKNTVSFQRGHHIDIFPTICELAGIDYNGDEIDGISLTKNLLEKKSIDRGTMFWQLDLYSNLQRHYKKSKPYANTIVYEGPWKLLLDSIRPVELFHLENDPHEVMNKIDNHPEVVEDLTDKAKIFLNEPRYMIQNESE